MKPALAVFAFDPVFVIVGTFVVFEIDLLAMVAVKGFVVCFETYFADWEAFDFGFAPGHGISWVGVADFVEALLLFLVFEAAFQIPQVQSVILNISNLDIFSMTDFAL